VPYSYQVTVTDYDFPISYSATQLPSWLSISTSGGDVTGTPPGPGTYVFNPIANNLAGSTGLQVTLAVAPTSSGAPQITSAASASCTAGTPYTYQILANDGPITAYSALALPPGLLFNETSGLIYGTPTTAGTYNVPITVTNAVTTYAAVLTMTIGPTPVPVLSSSLAVGASPNSLFSYQIPATGIVSSYSETGALPTGLQLNTSTGIISGTPTTSGTYTVTVSATNGTGTSSSTLTLTVSAQTSTASATDTPTMPPWALVVLAVILFAGGSCVLPKFVATHPPSHRVRYYWPRPTASGGTARPGIRGFAGPFRGSVNPKSWRNSCNFRRAWWRSVVSRLRRICLPALLISP
jgi:hypothetical protein